MNNELRVFTEDYIKRGELILKEQDNLEAERFLYEAVPVFSQHIPNALNGLNVYINDCYLERHECDYLKDIPIFISKLRLFIACKGNYSNNTTKKGDISLVNQIDGSGNSTNTVSPNITTTNTNTQNQTVNNTFDIKVELDKVRAEVEADEVLGDEDKEEINEKLNEIEEVMNGSPTNNEKWKKLKGVVNWVTTKGFKIGKMIMPIITKALFPEE